MVAIVLAIAAAVLTPEWKWLAVLIAVVLIVAVGVADWAIQRRWDRTRAFQALLAGAAQGKRKADHIITPTDLSDWKARWRRLLAATVTDPESIGRSIADAPSSPEVTADHRRGYRDQHAVAVIRALQEAGPSSLIEGCKIPDWDAPLD